jgi:hypothetical protein
MSTNGPAEPNDLADELSLLEIIDFIQEGWKIIFSFIVLGISGAALYLLVVPNQYEARAQIKMAQVPSVSNHITSAGTNIEEPQVLILRMALPTSYPKEASAICGLADQKNADTQLAKSIKYSIPKGVVGILELEYRHASKEIAKACVDAIFQLIKSTQSQIFAPFIIEAKKRLKMEEERLSLLNQAISKIPGSEVAASTVYLSSREEVRHLLDQISHLKYFIASQDSRATKLLAPIYVKEQPIFPPKKNTLLIGLLLGGILGLTLALARKWYRSKRATLNR